jgi:pimeloyl-ACP methyl ester carboxylesterase
MPPNLPPIATARHDGVEIAYYETFGPPGGDGDPLLLITGVGMQMLYWPEAFCAALVARGFRVARFDNRDAGLSTHLTQAGVPNLLGMLIRRGKNAPYRLEDMAEDAVAVLDALGWRSAHVAGRSLGGMIAQTLAIQHPDRVRSLTLIGSTPSWRIGKERLATTLRLVTARLPASPAPRSGTHRPTRPSAARRLTPTSAPPGTARRARRAPAAVVAARRARRAGSPLLPGCVVGAQRHRVAGRRQDRLGGAHQVVKLGDGQPVEGLAADRAPGDQPAVAQAGQMARHGGLGQPDGGGQVDHAPLAASQLQQDRQAAGVGQATKQRGRAGDHLGIDVQRLHWHTPMIQHRKQPMVSVTTVVTGSRVVPV